MRRAAALSLASLLWILAFGAVHAAAPAVERQRIEELIGSVERLPNAKFIRNGASYDARAAAEHLRLKLREAGDRVRTAEDFIRLCASKSSVSGNPYRIRFDDGTLVTSEAFLRARLKELDAPAK